MTMKKIYQTPETVIIDIELKPVLSNVSAYIDEEQSIEKAEDFGARSGGSFWDDEDEY